jgi:hypothetical protein
MGKKIKVKCIRTGKVEYVNEEDLLMITKEDLIRGGYYGREEQYKYFCEHPEEIEDQKLFSELKEEFENEKEN